MRKGRPVKAKVREVGEMYAPWGVTDQAEALVFPLRKRGRFRGLYSERQDLIFSKIKPVEDQCRSKGICDSHLLGQ